MSCNRHTTDRLSESRHHRSEPDRTDQNLTYVRAPSRVRGPATRRSRRTCTAVERGRDRRRPQPAHHRGARGHGPRPGGPVDGAGVQVGEEAHDTGRLEQSRRAGSERPDAEAQRDARRDHGAGATTQRGHTGTVGRSRGQAARRAGATPAAASSARSARVSGRLRRSSSSSAVRPTAFPPGAEYRVTCVGGTGSGIPTRSDSWAYSASSPSTYASTISVRRSSRRDSPEAGPERANLKVGRVDEMSGRRQSAVGVRLPHPESVAHERAESVGGEHRHVELAAALPRLAENFNALGQPVDGDRQLPVQEVEVHRPDDSLAARISHAGERLPAGVAVGRRCALASAAGSCGPWPSTAPRHVRSGRRCGSARRRFPPRSREYAGSPLR